MKKLFIPAILILAVVAFTNCNNRKQNQASASAREYSEYLRDGNYDLFVTRVVADNDFDNEDLRRNRTQYSENLRHNVTRHVNKHGGIKDVKVISDNTSKDGNTANVVVRHNYNDGKYDDVAYDLRKMDNEWKVRVGPNKEVWKTQLADGTHVTLKMKENDNKEVFKQHIGDERDFVKVKESEDGDKRVLKVKDGDDKDVLKIKEKDDEIVIKEKHNGDKEVRHIDKD